jgi:hypothetical protein
MKVTLDIPDKLYRRARAEAARRGCTPSDLIAQGLKRVLGAETKVYPKRRLGDLMRRARGMVDSGSPDLGTNRALKGFGE